MDDTKHPEIGKVNAKLEEIQRTIRGHGYIPDTTWVLQDKLSEPAKQHQLCRHSEKLAIAYGLLSTPPDTTLTIVKNLRMCGDCHTATKAISKAYQREILVRDASRFHHFDKSGKCSCGDYY